MNKDYQIKALKGGSGYAVNKKDSNIWRIIKVVDGEKKEKDN